MPNRLQSHIDGRQLSEYFLLVQRPFGTGAPSIVYKDVDAAKGRLHVSDDSINLRLKGIYQITDFRSVTYGATYLNGKNGFGKRGHIVGADATYLWRENGLEEGGKRATSQTLGTGTSFSIRSEPPRSLMKTSPRPVRMDR